MPSQALRGLISRGFICIALARLYVGGEEGDVVVFVVLVGVVVVLFNNLAERKEGEKIHVWHFCLCSFYVINLFCTQLSGLQSRAAKRPVSLPGQDFIFFYPLQLD